MCIRVYTVLSAYADGSRGIENIKQYGIYRNIDAAYLMFKELVKEKQPEDFFLTWSGCQLARHPRRPPNSKKLPEFDSSWRTKGA